MSQQNVQEGWTLEDLKQWVAGLLASHRVVAPVAAPEGAVWAQVDSPEKIAWDYGKTPVSPRSWLLPRCEELFGYDLGSHPPAVTEPPLPETPTAVLLLRPCDVAGLRALDAVMRWDYQDETYEARRRSALLVSLGCLEAPNPESCFCRSAGVDPSWAPEADVHIEPLPGGRLYHVYGLTEAGNAALAGAARPVAEGRAAPSTAAVPEIDLAGARAWMRDHFEDPLWREISEACLGCGACAYVCPSCHCFDMVDQGDWRRGRRVRNWDSCQFGHFTAHASGHNPRPEQWNRYRQRVYHKFQYYPDKFERLLCTGCGRCIEACPAGIDLIEVLQSLAAAGRTERPAPAAS